MNITSSHKKSKKETYWNDLIGGTTSQYKEEMMLGLVDKHYKRSCEKLLDVGCGTCEVILKYASIFKAKSLTCLDYDASIIEKMKNKYSKESITWKVSDIFDIQGWSEKFDLIFLLDMLHEIYSFYGRTNKDIQSPVDHALGIGFVRQAITNLAEHTNKGGGMIITDNILCEQSTEIWVLLRNQEVLEAVQYFFNHYPTKRFKYHLEGHNILRINSRDFCILLTQYNKIKSKDFDRWNVERFEIHQYMTLKEYQTFFRQLGFSTYHTVGTPKSSMQEWENDFEVLKGFTKIPEKRITLLAIKD